jgi:MoxR-like ATPase
MEYNADLITQLAREIGYKAPLIDAIRNQLKTVIAGQQTMIDKLLVGLLSNGHVLLEGVPGLAKTLTIKSLAKAVGGQFSRIQFTPDLLPADITGTMIYHQQRNEFYVRKGPIFANFVLADEINRAPAKVQSALLEAMQERQVTIGDQSYPLDNPFLVLATQNPLEQEGTYPLPEAQADRFIMKVVVGYPSRSEEQQIIRMNVQDFIPPTIETVVDLSDIIEARSLTKRIYMDEKIEQYILDIVLATRNPAGIGLPHLAPLIGFGGSPRASINLALTAKANAFLQKRAYTTPEDVRAHVYDVLRHRIGLTYEAEAEGKTVAHVIQEIIEKIHLP